MKSVALVLMMGSMIACAQGGQARAVHESNMREWQKQDGSITVEGANLQARLNAGRKLAQSRRAQTLYLIGYSFPVRSGVAVDGVPGVSGIVSGSLGEYETRNLGVFLLRDPSHDSVMQVQVRNLDREWRDDSVYWLGAASTEESLGLLESVVQSSSIETVAEGAVVAIALHDDETSVAPLLRNFARQARFNAARQAAVMWLGR